MTTKQQILESSGIAQPGEQISMPLPLGDIRVATITLFSDRPDLLADVNNPQGKLTASARTSDRPLKDVPSSEGVYSARILLNAPTDGMWHIQMSTAQETHYTILADAETSTILKVHTDRSRYPVGAPIKVTAELLKGRFSMSGGTMKVELGQGSKLFQSLDLREVNSGVFEGQFAPVNQAARPDLLITAINGTIQRQVSVPLVIIEPSVRILGAQTEQALDSDNDGKANKLTIEVQLEVKRAGRYTLAAHLEGQGGKPITYAEYNTAMQAALGHGDDTLKAGHSVISLSFSGQEIQSRKINGPYSIRLVVYDTDQAGAEIDMLEYTTRMYQATDFE